MGFLEFLLEKACHFTPCYNCTHTCLHFCSRLLLATAEWTEYGTFSVKLNYNFCHIHYFMSRLIKLPWNAKPLQPANIPAIKYSHPKTSLYDKSCGMYSLAPFQLPHSEYPSKLICGKQSHFEECIGTMNCFMMVGMALTQTREMIPMWHCSATK